RRRPRGRLRRARRAAPAGAGRPERAGAVLTGVRPRGGVRGPRVATRIGGADRAARRPGRHRGRVRSRRPAGEVAAMTGTFGEAPRLAARRRLLVWGTPVAVAALALGSWLGVRDVIAGQVRDAYLDGDYAQAQWWNGALRFGNVAE